FYRPRRQKACRYRKNATHGWARASACSARRRSSPRSIARSLAVIWRPVAHRIISQVPSDLPVVRSLGGRLLTLPAFTKVSERFVRECAAALRKVAAYAASKGQDAAPRGKAA